MSGNEVDNEVDRDRCLASLYKRYRSKARYRDLAFTLARDEFDPLVLSDCAYCGSNPSNVYKRLKGLRLRYNGLDRIDNRHGYEVGNVLPACSFCNSLRGPMKWKTWSHFIVGVVKTHGGQVPDWLDADDDERPSKSYYGFGGG